MAHSLGNMVVSSAIQDHGMNVEVWDYISPLMGFDADVRRNTWQKQELYKGRSWIYGTGWAGWGFKTNMAAFGGILQ